MLYTLTSDHDPHHRVFLPKDRWCIVAGGMGLFMAQAGEGPVAQNRIFLTSGVCFHTMSWCSVCRCSYRIVCWTWRPPPSRRQRQWLSLSRSALAMAMKSSGMLCTARPILPVVMPLGDRVFTCMTTINSMLMRP